ncbi:MAG: 3-deoxy-manno-octulosonate cytidylyltransferase, partial [Bacteroidota bacterium]|nr:3-deoxy-manno-octulosonate cytidylyltransferase [Bacteroidota bacterium]
CFDDPRTELATLIKEIHSEEILLSPNSPKAIVDAHQFAIYFSRHPIPYLRDVPTDRWLQRHQFFQHIGIYGYTVGILRKITQLPPSSLEKAESLEQLRWLENGFRIKTAVTTADSIAIDTPEDLQRVVATLGK